MTWGKRLTIVGRAVMIAFTAMCVAPAASEAIDVTVRVLPANATDATAPLATCPTPFAQGGSGNTLTRRLPTSCAGGGGTFNIVNQPGSVQAEAAALTGVTQNQLVVRTTRITLNAPTTLTLMLEIDVRHVFTLPSPYTVFGNRYYGVGFNASFARAGGLQLAANDRIVKRGFYSYVLAPPATGFSVEDQIGGAEPGGPGVDAQQYIVPATGSTTQNTLPVPSKQASESAARKCSDLVPAPTTCVPNQERLRTNIRVTLRGGDQITIPNGSHGISGGDFFRDPPPGGEGTVFEEGTGSQYLQTTLDLLSAQLRVHQNTPVTTLNPFDQGHLTLILVGNENFDVRNVDLGSLTFGPDAAVPVSADIKDTSGPDGKKDGIEDLILKVRMPQTGIACGDTTGTLTGVYVDPDIAALLEGFPLLDPSLAEIEFHSTAGFAAVSNQCP